MFNEEKFLEFIFEDENLWLHRIVVDLRKKCIENFLEVAFNGYVLENVFLLEQYNNYTY